MTIQSFVAAQDRPSSIILAALYPVVWPGSGGELWRSLHLGGNLESVNDLNMQVFGLWEEGRVPGES